MATSSHVTGGTVTDRSFAARHIGTSTADQDAMLKAVGQPSLDALMDACMPALIRSHDGLNLPAAITETEAQAELAALAAQNTPARSMIGLGYHGTHTPAVIRRNVLENPSWYTAYTPYQAEISQGRLEALLNFQTMCADLTGLPVAGASLLDEATAAAEAMLLARRASKRKTGHVFAVDRRVLPQTLAVLKTRAEPVGIDLAVADLTDPAAIPDGAFGVLLQYPGADGTIHDWTPTVEAAHAAGALVAVAADLLALTLLTAPGDI
jgi:glycine dehydrogenase